MKARRHAGGPAVRRGCVAAAVIAAACAVEPRAPTALDASGDTSEADDRAPSIDREEAPSRADAAVADAQDAPYDHAALPVDLGPLVPRCEPGTVVACPCTNGAGGAQRCGATGTYEPCACDAGSSDGGAPSPGFVEVAVGIFDTCARRADGSVYCWGATVRHKNGFRAIRLVPVQMTELEGVVALGSSRCAIRSDGAALCWSCDGCLGSSQPVDPDPVPRVVPGVAGVVAVSHHAGTCYLRREGPPLCFGYTLLPGVRPDGERMNYHTPTALVGVERVAQLAGDGNTMCARTVEGQVWCWGAGDTSLGDGLTSRAETCLDPNDDSVPSLRRRVDCTTTPVRVTGVSDARSLVGGLTAYRAIGAHFCVLRASGQVLCWGHNNAGQLGDGTIDSRPAPTPVAGVEAVHVATSAISTCAALRDGRVMCWGANDYGQLGDGRADHGTRCHADDSRFTFDCSPRPVAVIGLTRILQVSVHERHACALQEGGRVFCWGDNSVGQLGDDSTADSDVPVAVRAP